MIASALLVLTWSMTQTAAERPRFIDHGEYVEDTTTKLLWQKDGDVSGKMNFYQAAEYAEKLKLGGLSGWRVPTRAELKAIFPATKAPFRDTQYNEAPYKKGPGEWHGYWTGELDPRLPDYAYLYQWYAAGGANNCYASKNHAYVRCVRGAGDAATLATTEPPKPLDAATTNRARELIAKLGSPEFSTRERATAELRALGAPVHGLLREALKNTTDLEVKFRLEIVLAGE